MTFHSIWLRPARDDLRFLESVVTDLASSFNSPIFEPHATLVSDMKRSADELLPLVLSLAVGRKPLDVLVDDVAGTEAYSRPHVSLAYGVADHGSRDTEMARMARLLVGRSIRFDRMVIVSSSSETPIGQWIVKHEVYLAG